MSWFKIFNRAQVTGDNLVKHELENFRKEVSVETYESMSKKAVLDFAPTSFSINPGRKNLTKAYQYTSDWQLFRMEKYYEYESIIYNIINKFMQLILKNGYEFNLKEKYKDKIKEKELFLLEFEKLLRSGPKKYLLHQFISLYVKDWLVYGNVFLRKKYEDIRYSRNLYDIEFSDPLKFNIILDKDNEKLLNYVYDPQLRKRGDYTKGYITGTNTNYVQKYGGMVPKQLKFGYFSFLDKKLKDYEILHIKYENLHQAAFSMPLLYPILDDIVALRSIEEDIQLLSYQYGHPLLHTTIDYTDLSDIELEQESTRMRQQLEKMEGNGMVITSSRVKMELKAALGQLPDLVKFHSLFLSRIERGSGMPGLFTGSSEKTGGGRQTAETMEASTYGSIRHMATSLSEGLQPLIDEIWYTKVDKSQKIYDPSTPSCPIVLHFFDPDDNENRAKEQHLIQLWNSSAITHDEFRKLLGKKPDTSLNGKYLHDIKETEQISKTAASLNSISNPSNQHGTKTKAGSRKDEIE